MESMSDEIILPDSELAASYAKNIKGWVSRNGLFFGDGDANRDAARYNGCTHVSCQKCRQPVRKGWLLCESCREESELSRYLSMPTALWDGQAMLYSQVTDNYYRSPDEAEDELQEGQTLSSLRLIICKPNHIHLDADEFSHVAPGDEELPEEVLTAIDAFNESVCNIVVSWSPSNVALLVSEPADM